MPTNPPPLISRRTVLGTGLTGGASALALAGEPATAAEPERSFRYCLNMSTIRGQNLDAAQEIEVAAKAGYDAIEPWFRKIDEYLAAGGKLSDLRKRIDDHGLIVASAIGFANWIVDDDSLRAEGLETAKKDMDTIAQLGGVRLAAPPAGAKGPVDLDLAAERYRALLELGAKMGVAPQIEMWGPSPAIGTVEKAVYIAIRADHPMACFLGDTYHMYKGGCGIEGLRLLGPHALQNFHMNDYPADPVRADIKDEHRVYPGDGVGKVVETIRLFREIGACPVLSLELFNKTYWAQPADEVAKTGLEKMKAVVATALQPS
jgi:2-keto-myo-inositol isomerase